ncbi:MAG TPA: hypothetical protein VFC00_31590 [Micromonosporaceae bacterium]|nr:hypothetical protein [Micromonosporaceae bacterium]
MTALVERIEVRPVEVRRGVLTAIAAVFWLVGWLTVNVVLVTAAAVRWSVAAVRLGWRDGQEQWAARAKRRAAA